ncbi:MAG: hypothetical protein V1701_00510 [Planctomycetota bacterium]
MKYNSIRALAFVLGLAILLVGSRAGWGGEPAKTPAPAPAPTVTDVDAEILRLKEALNERDLPIKLWAIRSLAKYQQSLCGPILLEQFERPMSEDTLIIRCAIVYCFYQMEYRPAIPQLVQLLKMDLTKYGWPSPEVAKEQLDEFRRIGAIKKDSNPTKKDTDKKDNDPSLGTNLREQLENARRNMLMSYEQKLNWGLLYIRTMQTLGRLRAKEASDELYRLTTTPEIPISYMAVDTLKLVDDQKILDLLTKNSLLYWRSQFREQAIYTITEVNSPYRKKVPYEGSEWLRKSLFKLVVDAINVPGQSNDCTIKALNMMDILSKPNCQIYDFTSENNLIKEFMDMTNGFKRNNPEVMLYDYDLIIKFIKDEMMMRALYNIFGDVLKPPPVIVIQTPSVPLEQVPSAVTPLPVAPPELKQK